MHCGTGDECTQVGAPADHAAADQESFAECGADGGGCGGVMRLLEVGVVPRLGLLLDGAPRCVCMWVGIVAAG